MKYYTIVFPGEFGQHVQETWSEAQIIKSYYTYWVGKMIQNAPDPTMIDLSSHHCIDSWCVVHWAVETDQFGNKLKDNQMNTIEFWSIENTGWSGGISWFKIGGTETNPMRFNNKFDALSYADKLKTALNQDTTLWRVVHTTIERKEFEEITTRTWTLL